MSKRVPISYHFPTYCELLNEDAGGGDEQILREAKA